MYVPELLDEACVSIFDKDLDSVEGGRVKGR